VNTDLTPRTRWFVVAGYAAAMAWVEAAVVYYLRTMVNRIEPYQPDPLPLIGGLGRAELVREAATLLMLLAVGVLAGRSWRSRLGFSALAFGVWDILYYVFLKILCGWPRSLLDWDILFLLPLPWWGPVLAPMLISLSMILWGTLAGVDRTDDRGGVVEKFAWLMNLCGVVLALSVFMQDTLAAAKHGTEAVRHVMPHQFNWRLFGLALTFMSAPPALALARRISRRSGKLARPSLTEQSDPVRLKSTFVGIARPAVTSGRNLET
jgi:hypothetical protein